MAVDTRNKRASCLGFASPWRVLPNPDGAVGQPDRQHVAYSYPGIQADEALGYAQVYAWTGTITRVHAWTGEITRVVPFDGSITRVVEW
jgi:hypothetical protein